MLATAPSRLPMARTAATVRISAGHQAKPAGDRIPIRIRAGTICKKSIAALVPRRSNNRRPGRTGSVRYRRARPVERSRLSTAAEPTAPMTATSMVRAVAAEKRGAPPRMSGIPIRRGKLSLMTRARLHGGQRPQVFEWYRGVHLQLDLLRACQLAEQGRHMALADDSTLV